MSGLASSPKRARLLAAAREVGPILEKYAGESERERRLANPAVEAMLDAGLFQCATPREVGGFEADPLTQLELYEIVAATDTAAAWNLMNGAQITGFVAARLRPPALDAFFETQSWPIAAGHTASLGRAVSTCGGYRLSGAWRFASGIHQASWAVAGCHVFDGDVARTTASGDLQRWLAVVPIDAVQVEDTWHVAGLRGTGSCDYTIDDVLIGESFLVELLAPTALRGGNWWRLPFGNFVQVGHAGFALGVSRRCLREVRAVADRRRTGATSPPSERESVQLDLGRLMAMQDGARLLVQNAIRELWAATGDGQLPARAQALRLRVAMIHATEVAVASAQFAFRLAGAGALFEHAPAQRYLRDVLAAQRHAIASDAGYVEYGRFAFGGE